MPSKEYRQRKIVELVEKRIISTQAEIAEYLASEEGIHVTGTGVVYGEPDTAVLDVGVSTVAEDVADVGAVLQR